MNILWDFDGTLFNTYPIYTKIFQEVMDENIREEEIFKLLKVSFSHAVDFFQLSEEQVKLIRNLISKITPDKTPPFPYVEDVLKKANKNVIMTHKERNEVNTILKFYNWNQYFEEVVAIDNGFPRKPHPASYEYLHNKYELDLIIGDREIHILPGKQLHIKTCLFQNNQAGADFYLTDFKDFEKIIKS
ncbi:HAD-IA family hydrolase [Heyndrickxia sporothermodurans]